MKVSLILFLIIASLSIKAQVLPSSFSGDWEATCVKEKLDTDKIAVCGICPHIISDSNSRIISSVTLNFSNKDLTIITPDRSTTVPIKYNEKLEHLVFTNNGITYDFSILYVDVLSKIILKSQNGNIIYLERKNNLRSK
jgi:hypothetical protein